MTMATLTYLLTGALLMCSMILNATVWRVNNQGYSADFTGSPGVSALQQAINDDSVEPGDTLHLEASPTDYGNVEVNKPLVIIGPGYFLDENTTPQLQNNANKAMIAQLYFPVTSSGSRVSGISQLNLGNTGHVTYIEANDIVISRSRMRAVVLQGTGLNNVVLTQNYIDEYFITSNISITGLTVRNNRAASIALSAASQGDVSHNVFFDGASVFSPIQFYNNIIRGGSVAENNNTAANVHHNILSSSPTWLSGSTNHLGLAPVQVFSTANPTPDGSLQTLPAGSCGVCHTGGLNGGGIGMFFGAQPYILSGIPAIPAIFKLWANGSAVQGDNLPVTIGTRSND